jgi:HSP20 family molecular chaperone IbpA
LACVPRLPSGVNSKKAEATFRDGILTLTIPKVEPIQPQEIKVKSV